MAAGNIRVAKDGEGKQVQNFVNTVEGTTVYAQAVCLVDSSGEEVTTTAVSIESLPLPSDAATETSLAALLAKNVQTPASEITMREILTELRIMNLQLQTVTADIIRESDKEVDR